MSSLDPGNENHGEFVLTTKRKTMVNKVLALFSRFSRDNTYTCL